MTLDMNIKLLAASPLGNYVMTADDIGFMKLTIIPTVYSDVNPSLNSLKFFNGVYYGES